MVEAFSENHFQTLRGNTVKIEFGYCQIDELEVLISLIDKEFIFDKDRKISLRIRFPQLFSPGNCHNIYVARVNNRIAATAIVKSFTWQVESEIYQGAMIGMVCTLPEYRGNRIASQLMGYLQTDLQRRGFDFAVLWTGKTSFYQRLGWHLSDRSILGILDQPQVILDSNVDTDSISKFPLKTLLNSERVNEILSIYQHSDFGSLGKVGRSLQDYLNTPVPAISVEMYIYEEVKDCQAYALVGRIDHNAYIYEVLGNPLAYGKLWTAITKNFNKVCINTSRDSILYKSLNQHNLSERNKLRWEAQLKAMWYQFPREKKMPFDQWYIPYSDRI
jgi:predicted acetyltransferase